MTKEELFESFNDDNIKNLTIEESLGMLEELLNVMDSSEISLEDSFMLYENGLKLVKHAKDGIDCVEKKLRILSSEE